MSASDEVPALGSRRVWRFTVQLLKREIYCHHVMYWSRDKCRPAGSVWLFCSFSEAEANVSCQASWRHYVPVIAADLSLVGYMCTTAKTTAWIHEMLHLLHSMQMKLWLAAVQPLAASRAPQACTPAVYFGTGLKISDNLVSLTPWQFQLSRTGGRSFSESVSLRGFLAGAAVTESSASTRRTPANICCKAGPGLEGRGTHHPRWGASWSWLHFSSRTLDWSLGK